MDASCIGHLDWAQGQGRSLMLIWLVAHSAERYGLARIGMTARIAAARSGRCPHAGSYLSEPSEKVPTSFMEGVLVTGTCKTTLIVLRGNSGSGKTTVARALQQQRGRDQLAVISQDVVRREVLWANDRAGNPAIGLIDLMARYALDQGFSVVVEGILHPDRYGDMLRRLVRDHTGRSLAYFWDVPFEETVRRHATKPKAAEFGEREMRDWWYGAAFVDGLSETTIGIEETLGDAVRRVSADCGWA